MSESPRILPGLFPDGFRRIHWPLLMGLLAALLVHPEIAHGVPRWQVEAPEVAAGPKARATRPASFSRAALIEFKGPITVGMLQYFKNRLSQAKRQRCDLVVVEIASPGGLLNESYEIAEMLRDVDWAYTVAFSTREALSGAALICFGCDEMVVAPTMRLGDIGVIYQDPNLFAFRLVPAKIQSDVVTFGRALAESKGRPPEIIEAMIDKDVAVYTRIDEEGKRRFQTHRLGTPAPPPEPWIMLPESGEERFLELTGDRVVELGLASSLASSRNEMQSQFDLPTQNWLVYRHKTIDSVASFLSNPIVTGLLVVIGFLALYLEFSAPGIGIGGTIAGLCAVLFFWSRFMGGTAGALEIILFLAGLVFIAMELFVIPGWGLSGMAGLFLLFSSIVMASQNFVVPQNAEQWNQFLTTLAVLLCSGCFSLLGAAMITKKLGKIPVFNQMVLAPRFESSDDGDSQDARPAKDGVRKPYPVPHPIVSVGDWGVAVSQLRPAGLVRFAERSIDVISDGEFIEPGQQVKVITIQGNRVIVTSAVDLENTRAKS